MWLYILERKDKDGFTERIQAWAPCKGWRTVGKIKISLTPEGYQTNH